MSLFLQFINLIKSETMIGTGETWSLKHSFLKSIRLLWIFVDCFVFHYYMKFKGYFIIYFWFFLMTLQQRHKFTQNLTEIFPVIAICYLWRHHKILDFWLHWYIFYFINITDCCLKIQINGPTNQKYMICFQLRKASTRSFKAYS